MMNCPPRFCTMPNPERKNQLRIARKIAKLLGIRLMEWQELVLALFTEQDHGKYMYSDSTLVVARQSGKSLLTLCLILTQALRYPGSQIWFSAQDLKSARAMMVEVWWPLIAASPLSDMFTLRKSSGSEQIQCRNGSVVHLLTATSKLAGHGSVCDLYVGDEYFAVQDTRLETAMLPAQATRSSFGGGPRSIFVSTPGTPATSQPLLQRTERGRQLVASGVTTGASYVEWSAPDDADPSDPAVWAAANPAYGQTISADAVRAEFESMGLVDFRRSRLAQWTTTVNDPVIDLATWERLVDVNSKRGKSLALAFDSSPAGEYSSIAVASIRDDGLYHVAVLAHREGTGWLAKEVHRLYVAHHPNVIMCDPRSPAANALPELFNLGVQVEELPGTDQAKAFSAFVAACQDDKLRHGNQPELTAALIGGVRRKLGDAYAWSRSSSAVDISPIVAVSEALFAVQTIDTEIHIYSIREILDNRKDDNLIIEVM
jgi:phage terminase large subunit-like protein